MTAETKLELGDRAKCVITGASGIVVCVAQWLNGCVRIAIQPERAKDSKIPDALHFDAEGLELVKKGVHKAKVLEVAEAPAAPVSRTGGPGREGAGYKK